jgi:hypothetical protein
MGKVVTYCLEGQEWRDENDTPPSQRLWATGVSTNLKVRALIVLVENGERDVLPFKLMDGGKTLLVVPQLEGSQAQYLEIQPIPVDNNSMLRIECLELPKIRPVRAWGTLWVEVDDS